MTTQAETSTFTALIELIATELGPDWTVTQIEPDWWSPNATLERTSDGLGLYAYSRDGRLTVSARYPDGTPTYGFERYRATVSASRPARQIVGDIARRVIVPATPEHAAAVQRVRQDILNREAADAATTALAAALGHQPSPSMFQTASGSGSLMEQCSHASINVKPKTEYPSVDIELRGLGLDEAQQVVALWTTLRDAVRAKERAAV